MASVSSFSVTASATISPVRAPNLKPWPEQALTIRRRSRRSRMKRSSFVVA
jgi:hypothetical protein